MKLKIRLILCLVLLLFTSCQQNKEENFYKLSQQLVNNGKEILYQTFDFKNKNFVVIYRDGENIIKEDQTNKTIILSPDSKVTEIELYADFLSDGNLTVIKEDKGTKCFSEYCKNDLRVNLSDTDIRCLKGKYLLIEGALMFINNPTVVYSGVDFKNIFDGNDNVFFDVTGELTRYPHNQYKFKFVNYLDFYTGTCPFTWKVLIGTNGDIISKAPNIWTQGIEIPTLVFSIGDDLEKKYMPLIETYIYVNNGYAD